MSDTVMRPARAPGFVFLALGLGVGISLLLALGAPVPSGNPLGLLAAPGDLLFRSFSHAAWYLPLYLFSVAGLILARRARLVPVLLLSLGAVPAMLTGLALRLMLSSDFMASPLPGWLVQNLSHQGAVVVSAALALISLVALMQFPGYIRELRMRKAKAARLGLAPGRPEAAEAEPGAKPVIEEFRSAMSGKLESRLKNQTTTPVDLDAPLAAEEAKKIWSEEEELAHRQAAIEAGAYAPHRPMFYQAGESDPDDGLDTLNPPRGKLEVYFGKDGGISDYPPKRKRSWTTLLEEGPPDPVGPAAEHPAAAAEPAAPRSQALAPAGEETEADYLDPPVVLAPAHDPGPAARPLAPERAAPALDEEDRADFQAYAEDAVEADEEGEDADDELLEELGPVPVAPYRESAASGPVPAPAAGLRADLPEPEGIDESLLPPLAAASSRMQLPEGPAGYAVPIKGILEEPKNHQYWVIDDMTTRSASILKQTLEEFGIAADVTGIRKGPVITMFEILPAPGVKLAKIVNLADNIALRLAAQSVRIVAPIPGKHAVGIEIPNRERAVVSFAELLMAEGFSSPKIELPVALGKDITGDAQIVDLTRTPHLLIAGATGAGKSVCVNALICSLLYRRSPAEVNMILIDPKIVELKFYNDIPHLLTPVITDAKKAFQALQWCLFEMERRYSLLDAMQVRDIKSYNKKIKARHIATPHLPYLVVVIDEFADLMATSGKELEGTLARLAAMSRAVGIHLVLATQRPSADVITGLIKANIPSRIAFMVASKIDSRIIIDGMGAEKLLGKGDMLFTSAWDPFPFRMQGAFLTEDEVERVVAHVKTLGKPDYIDDEIFFDADEEDDVPDDEIDAADDPLLKEAIDIVVAAKKASASYIQRRLKIGYNRAARMVEQMEEMGIVGPAQGSKPREILRMFQ